MAIKLCVPVYVRRTASCKYQILALSQRIRRYSYVLPLIRCNIQGWGIFDEELRAVSVRTSDRLINLLLTPTRLFQSSALFDYPLLRLQHAVTPLANWSHALFSACRSPDGRFNAQRPLWFHVIRESTWTKDISDSFLFTSLPSVSNFCTVIKSSDPLCNAKNQLPKPRVHVGN